MTNQSSDHRKKLYEDYEDSLFRLIMNDAAEKEGKLFLEENSILEHDPHNQPSSDSVKRFEHKLTSQMKKTQNWKQKPFMLPIVKKVAVFLIAVIAVFSAALVQYRLFASRC